MSFDFVVRGRIMNLYNGYLADALFLAGTISLTLLLGALGASIKYLFDLSSSIRLHRTTLLIYSMRICLGSLFSLIVALPFYNNDRYYTVLPFFVGYSVTALIYLLNYVVDAIQNAMLSPNERSAIFSTEKDVSSTIQLAPIIFGIGLLMFIIGVVGSIWTTLQNGENALPYAALMALGSTTGALSLLSGRTGYGEGQASEPGRSSVISHQDVRSAR
jgi:hypothetical protein